MNDKQVDKIVKALVDNAHGVAIGVVCLALGALFIGIAILVH